MRFSIAWAKVVAQNVTLKVAILSISFCLVFMGFVSVRLALKEPLVIERSCYSQVVPRSSSKHSQEEIKTFVKEALFQRFDTQLTSTHFLSIKELALRKREQEELSKRRMTQKVLVNTVETKKDGIFVDADRLISVDKIRSAFMFPLKVRLASTTRTRNNPYGLVLDMTEVQNEETENEKTK